ncbi:MULTISPECIES: hypothetical protein [Chryseobacterium]|jgi:hypothetical protein|uniref:Uncharacterized protein n=1 Tax=Chryseobacterium geocarposphaerae TaxID=1416776 RepID=A0ABU1L991_9FLAO|nr:MULTISPECIES: hypothetical protein [Chryseobacterium]ALR29410.1 hypothetical protein ATE47_02160 [Chryseobacterium sp. IHB B 17019]MDR6403284.1 hypothetical protein [Chryseobacterium geocarposphaerae]MDR6696838.1 hypothetical protein [Chryseobacterium ginsenosidimutans]
MKIIKLFYVLVILFGFSNCIDQKQKDDEQIKNVVSNFWKAVKENDETAYLSLIEDSESEYKLAMLNQLHYLNRNYNKLNHQNSLLNKVEIKETNESGTPQKVVGYEFIKQNSTVEPLSVRLFFYKSVGYNKIFNVQILGNLPEWEKQ